MYTFIASKTLLSIARLLPAIIAIGFVLPAQAETIFGRVVRVSDGDTIAVLDANHKQHKIRLAGIDAPEKRQAFGNVSKQNLARMVFQKDVTIDYAKRDRHGRIVGKVLFEGGDVCMRQIQDGLAWHFKKYEREQPALDRNSYSRAELDARAAGLVCGGMHNQSHRGNFERRELGLSLHAYGNCNEWSSPRSHCLPQSWARRDVLAGSGSSYFGHNRSRQEQAGVAEGKTPPPDCPRRSARTAHMTIRGWVYVVTNQAMPGLVKIGYSTKDPHLRASELNHTGSPHKYLVEFDVLVLNPQAFEQRIHHHLLAKREGKEWFRCTVSEAISSITSVAGKDMLLRSPVRTAQATKDASDDGRKSDSALRPSFVAGKIEILCPFCHTQSTVENRHVVNCAGCGRTVFLD